MKNIIKIIWMNLKVKILNPKRQLKRIIQYLNLFNKHKLNKKFNFKIKLHHQLDKFNYIYNDNNIKNII